MTEDEAEPLAISVASIGISLIPWVGGAAAKALETANAHDRQRNKEQAERMFRDLDEEQIARFSENGEVSHYVIRTLERLRGVRWREQAILCAGVVNDFLKDPETIDRIDEGEAFVDALMGLKRQHFRGLARLRHECAEAAAADDNYDGVEDYPGIGVEGHAELIPSITGPLVRYGVADTVAGMNATLYRVSALGTEVLTATRVLRAACGQRCEVK